MYFKTSANRGQYSINYLDPMMISIQNGVTTIDDMIESLSSRLKARYFKKGAELNPDECFFELFRVRKMMKGIQGSSEEMRKLTSVDEIGANDAIYVILDVDMIWDLFDENLCNHPKIVDCDEDGPVDTHSADVDLFKCLDKFVSEEVLGESDMWVRYQLYIYIFKLPVPS